MHPVWTVAYTLLFALDAMSLTAEIARHHGVNLYDYTSQGKNLKMAFDYLAPYVANPASWPYEMITPHAENEDLSAYELAYSYWKRPRHLAVFGRTVREMLRLSIDGLDEEIGVNARIAFIELYLVLENYLRHI